MVLRVNLLRVPVPLSGKMLQRVHGPVLHDRTAVLLRQRDLDCRRNLCAQPLSAHRPLLLARDRLLLFPDASVVRRRRCGMAGHRYLLPQSLPATHRCMLRDLRHLLRSAAGSLLRLERNLLDARRHLLAQRLQPRGQVLLSPRRLVRPATAAKLPTWNLAGGRRLRTKPLPAAQRRVLHPRGCVHHPYAHRLHGRERFVAGRLNLHAESVPRQRPMLPRLLRILLHHQRGELRQQPMVLEPGHNLHTQSLPAPGRSLLRTRRHRVHGHAASRLPVQFTGVVLRPMHTHRLQPLWPLLQLRDRRVHVCSAVLLRRQLAYLGGRRNLRRRSLSAARRLLQHPDRRVHAPNRRRMPAGRLRRRRLRVDLDPLGRLFRVALSAAYARDLLQHLHRLVHRPSTGQLRPHRAHVELVPHLLRPKPLRAARRMLRRRARRRPGLSTQAGSRLRGRQRRLDPDHLPTQPLHHPVRPRAPDMPGGLRPIRRGEPHRHCLVHERLARPRSTRGLRPLRRPYHRGRLHVPQRLVRGLPVRPE